MNFNNEVPFSYLSNTVRIVILTSIENLLQFFSIVIEVNFATNIEEAEFIFNSIKINACILDDHEIAFKLSKKYPFIAFILFTDCKSSEVGFNAAKFKNICVVIDKHLNYPLKFISAMNTCLLSNIIDPKNENKDLILAMYNNPKTTIELARFLNITDRMLRYICFNKLNINSKMLIMIFKTYNLAFSYNEKSVVNLHKELENYTQLKDFFFLHRTDFLNFLNNNRV